jgi:hypothetical protein
MKFWNTDIIRTKKCTDCGEVKPITEFYKHKETADGYRGSCKECCKKQAIQWNQNNKELTKQYKAQYYQNNKERKKEYNSQYYQNNKEHLKEYSAQWYKDNKEHRNQYEKERYHSDPLYNLMRKLRVRTNQAFKRKGWKKDSSTQKMLGCDWETLKIHMESQFKDGMSWDNMGEWHDDHIIPLDCAIDEEEIKKLSHYTNLQPMWGPENQSKSNKVLKEHYDLHYKLLGRYYK